MPADAIPPLLAEFQNAVASRDLDEARVVLERIDSTYDELGRKEARDFHRTTELRRHGGVGDDAERQRLEQYHSLHATTELARSGLLAAGGSFLLDPSEADGSELAERVAELREQEQAFLELEREVRPLIEEADVPARVEIVDVSPEPGPHPVGTTAEIGVTVENVGDSPTGSRTVVVDTDASVSPSAESLPGLDPGEVTTADFMIDATNGGTVTVTIGFADRTEHTEQQVQVEILERDQFVAVAGEVLEELRTLIEESSEITGGFQRSALQQLSSAADSIDRAREHQRADRSTPAEQQLRTATRQLGGFLNAFEARATGGASQLSEELRYRVETQTEAAIDNLANAAAAVH